MMQDPMHATQQPTDSDLSVTGSKPGFDRSPVRIPRKKKKSRPQDNRQTILSVFVFEAKFDIFKISFLSEIFFSNKE